MAKKKDHIPESYSDIEEKGKRLDALINLSNDIREKERRKPIPINDFLHIASQNPQMVFRDIFQLFHDMVHYYVPEGQDEYEVTDETIGFVNYDTKRLFVEDMDNPFFADRLFANRFMNLIRGIKKGGQSNHINLFEGPPGSGKSTFLNNLLLKLEEYTQEPEGASYVTHWVLDLNKLGGFHKLEKTINSLDNKPEFKEFKEDLLSNQENISDYPFQVLEFSCPKNDHPILQIPKTYRKKFLDELIPDEKFKKLLFTKKEYEWVLKDNPCNICKSLYTTLLEMIDEPLKVFDMLHVRRQQFNRQLGESISVFNPGDAVFENVLTNPKLQELIIELLQNDNVRYLYSHYALTHNGVYALMDIKENNVDRLMNLHGIISDGVHKVGLFEEYIKSLFIGIVNPEDKRHYENIKSFQDRVITTNIPYILDYKTEVKIYKNKFGNDIEAAFLPMVLLNFAKIIISSRLESDSPALLNWIEDAEIYERYLDVNMFLLKMEVYTGIIPEWLTEGDIKRFDRKTRQEVLESSENEGRKGFSGRQSLNLFSTFYTKYADSENLITMDMVKAFFEQLEAPMYDHIPDGFIFSLIDMYDYQALQNVKEALYFYNEKEISRELLNYIYGINFEDGEKVVCEYTGDTIEISDDFFKDFELMILGPDADYDERIEFRKDVHAEYVTRTLTYEIKLEGKSITKTEQYKNLFDKYIRSMKENSLAPYLNNENFRRAIQDYTSNSFNTYDNKIKRDVQMLIKNLKTKFKYTQEGARQIILYVLDKKLADAYE